MNLRSYFTGKSISYYSGDKTNEEWHALAFDNPNGFIHSLLVASDKQNNLLKCFIENRTMRSEHTVAIYLFGLYIYDEVKKFQISMNNYIMGNDPDCIYDLRKEFMYYWYLSCIMHDFGYYEVKNDQVHSFYFTDSNAQNESDTVIRRITNIDMNTNVIPEAHKAIHSQYSNYQRSHSWFKEYIDHGFYSGLFFLDDRQKRFGEIESKLDHTGNYFDQVKKLNWSKNTLDVIQRDIAMVIISHNIWFCTESDTKEKKDEYTTFGLSQLMTHSPYYSHQQFPLLFLLTLIDTIDIRKFLDDSETAKCLDAPLVDAYFKVTDEIEINVRGSVLSITFPKNLQPVVDLYIKKLIGIQSWLQVGVREIKNGVRIHFV